MNHDVDCYSQCYPYLQTNATEKIELYCELVSDIKI